MDVAPPNPNAALNGTAARLDRTQVVAIIWVMYSTGTIFITTRIYARVYHNRQLLTDDYWMIFAWLAHTTMCALQTVQQDSLWYTTELASGRFPPDESTTEQLEQLVRWQFPIIKLFWVVLWSVKASFLSIFFRLVRPFPVRRRMWYCTVVFVFLAFVGCVVSSALTCSPPSDYFKAGACNSDWEMWRQRFNVIFSTSVDIASDICIMIIPLTILPTLQLNVRKKVGLGVAFCLGFIIICVALVRMTQIIVKKEIDLVGLALWSVVETSVAIIVGSLPPLKSFLTRNLKKHSSNKSGQAAYDKHSDLQDAFSLGSKSRTVMVAESHPMDDLQQSNIEEGRIYVQRMFETHVESETCSKNDDDEAAIVNKTCHAR